MLKSSFKSELMSCQFTQPKSLAWLSIALAISNLLGCSSPKMNYDVNTAKDIYKERQLKGAEDSKELLEQAKLDDDSVPKIRKKLIQFKYSAKSFENTEFKDFIKGFSVDQDAATDASSSKKSHAEWLSEESTISRDRNALRRSLVLGEMRVIQEQLNSYGTSAEWLKTKELPGEVSYKEIKLSNLVRNLSNQSGYPIAMSEGVRANKSRVSLQVSGNLLNVLEKLAKNYPIEVLINDVSQEVLIQTQEESQKKKLTPEGFTNLLMHGHLDAESHNEIAEFKDIVLLLTSGEAGRFNRRVSELRPVSINPAVTGAFDLLNKSMVKLSNKLKSFDQATASLLNKNQKQDVVATEEMSPSVMSKGTLDSKICLGRELITEKIYVYKESPKEIVRYLTDYFKATTVGGIPGQGQFGQPGLNGQFAQNAQYGQYGQNGMYGTNGTYPSGVNQQQIALNNQNQVAYKSLLDQVKSKLIQSEQVAKEDPKAIANSASDLDQAKESLRIMLEEADQKKLDPCATIARENEGLKIIEDPTGVVMTGTLPQIQIANLLVEDADIPTKQVLAEVFMVEVQKNWAQTLELQLGRQGLNASALSGSVSTLYNAANLASATNPSGLQGQITSHGGNISAFINMLETNSVGRSISSPTLIAKNGEEAKISKVVTLRNEVAQSTPAQIVGGSTIPALPNFVLQTLDIPLTLKIKPTINLHNKHVTIKFDYEETTINPGNYATPTESGTTKNVITSVFETAPGDIVVLAGLYQQNNSMLTNGLPGAAGVGALGTLLGGKNNSSTKSTELLLFIKPTVIEPKAYVAKTNSLR